MGFMLLFFASPKIK